MNKSNVKMLDYEAKWFQKSLGYAIYLASHDKKSLNKDTLKYYAYTDDNGCGYYYFHSPQLFKTYAFEMFKNSGNMRLVKDKALLESIWAAYAKLEDTKQFLDMCFQIKREEVMKEAQIKTEEKPIAVPMQIFYTSGLPDDMVFRCVSTSEMLKKTISKIKVQER